ncbi:MAG TPA: DNA/RNA non-specific endonuclease [Burkholderiales bacterium]
MIRTKSSLPALLALPLAACSVLAHAATEWGTVECSTTHVTAHNPGLARVSDTLLCFEGYLSNFDTAKNRDEDHPPRGVPYWIAHRVKKTRSSPESRARPRAWFTLPDLARDGLAPTDDSYKFSKKFRDKHANWYERGHLAQKYLAERLGESAGWFTHNVANAVPQKGQFNKTAWLSLECLTGAWANQYGEVWVVTGPIFVNGKPTRWLKSDNHKKALAVAIPDSLFKIVVRKAKDDAWEVLAFIYPQEHDAYRQPKPWDEATYLTSVAQIEKLTEEQFFVGRADKTTPPKSKASKRVWPVKKESYDTGCKPMAKDIA